MGLLKYHGSIMRNNENVEFFYCIEDSGLDQLKRPFFNFSWHKAKTSSLKCIESIRGRFQRDGPKGPEDIEESSIRS